LEPDAVGETGPLEALKRLVHAHVELRARSCETFFLVDHGSDQEGEQGYEAERAVKTIARCVRAAQQAGQVKSGDPDQFATLIVGAIAGASDLSRNGSVRSVIGAGDLLSLPLLLIDRLRAQRLD
jgi:hypothetical protein